MTVNKLLHECALPLTGWLTTRFFAKRYNPLFGSVFCAFALYRTAFHFYLPTKPLNAKVLKNPTYRKGITWGFVVTCLGALYLAPKSPYLGYAAGSILGILAAIKYPDTQAKKAT
ncbi:MAG: hypothetical protein K940chlam8_00286 [Chlamydiae bacterium]|nr:hypothetical protein [Chlamydiota bacterium]